MNSPYITKLDNVSNFLKKFACVFSKPQLKNAERYLTGLILSADKNIADLNANFIDKKDQSSLNRFLTQSKFDYELLNRKRLEILNSNAKTAIRSEGIIIFDDTKSTHTEGKMEGLDKIKDHKSGKYHHAHVVVTAHYPDSYKDYFLDFALYLRKKTIDSSQKLQNMGWQFKSKLELALELLEKNIDIYQKVNTVVFDSWYFSKDFVRKLKEYRKNFVSQIKMNRNITVNRRRTKVRDRFAAIDDASFEEMQDLIIIKNGEQEAKEIKFKYKYSESAYINSIGKIKLIFLKENRSDEKGAVLVTNKTDTDDTEIIRMYTCRWVIETFYRDVKQLFGFGLYQMVTLEGILRHWSLVFLAHTACITFRLTDKFLSKKQREYKTLGELVEYLKFQNTINFMEWSIEKYNEHGNLQKIIQELPKPKTAKV